MTIRRMEISGWDRAIFSTRSATWAPSVAAVFKNFRRAGVLKNRFREINVVPSGAPTSSRLFSCPPSIWYRQPVRLSPVFVISSTWETAVMLDKASPLNPREETVRRSSADRILLVEWRRNASGSSSRFIPQPLSVMRIKPIPPSRISAVMAVAPASMAFSISSFTTEAGRSTTSPAAIWLMVF